MKKTKAYLDRSWNFLIWIFVLFVLATTRRWLSGCPCIFNVIWPKAFPFARHLSPIFDCLTGAQHLSVFHVRVMIRRRVSGNGVVLLLELTSNEDALVVVKSIRIALHSLMLQIKRQS